RLKELEIEQAKLTSPELTQLDARIASTKEELNRKTKGKESPSNGYHSQIASSQDTMKWVQVDLGRSVPVDRIRLVPARPTDFADTPGFGFPLRYKVEVSDSAAFEHP